MAVVNMVVGATTPDGATFVAKVDGGGPVRVAVADEPSMTSPVFTSSQAVDAQGVARVSITGLDAATDYWWQVEDNSVLDTTVQGRFRTHPVVDAPANFTLVVSGDAGLNPDFPGVAGGELDADRVSNAPIHDTIRQLEPLMFVHMGDWGYPDWGSHLTDTMANRRTFYDNQLAQPNQATLFREVAFAYTWDDHDYANNDSDGTYVNKQNAADWYRERIPHYTLPDVDAIYHSWQIGRVLFAIMDTRYYRDPDTDPQGPSKTMLSSDQKDWLEALLTTTTAEAFVWLMPTPWIGTHIDNWGGFVDERAELTTMLINLGWADRTVMVTADTHALALDSGAGGNASFGGFPLMMTGSLDATPFNPTGGYDLLELPGRAQYGTIEVTDSGSVLGITLGAWRNNSLFASYTLSITFPIPPTPLPDVTNLLGDSVDVVFGVRVLEDFQTGPDPIGIDLDLIDGEVVIDGTRNVQSTASVRVNGTKGQDGESAFPRGLDRLLAPFGNEIFIRYGFDLGGDGILWVPLGYFRISDTDQEDAPLNPIELSCDDRMATIIDSELIDPRVYDPPMTVSDVFDDLILDIYPDAVIQFDDATGDVPLVRQVVIEKDRYKPLREMADSFGKLFYWDTDGVCRIETPPDPNNIVWNVRSGRRGALVNAQRGFKRKGIYNAVVVEGEGADDRTPVRAVVVDDDPNSPTRFGGPIGKVPLRLETPLVTTQPQATNAATVLLRRAIGAPYNVQFDSIVNPSLRPFEAIRITYNDGNRDVHLIDSVTIPLDEDAAMTAQTREQAVLVTGSA